MDVQTLIDDAGGVAKLAHRLGVARTTVLDWRRTRTIPGNRVSQIADKMGVDATKLLPLVQPPKSRDDGVAAAEVAPQAPASGAEAV